MGYGDGDEATVVSFGGNPNNKHITTYFRKTINLAAGAYVGATLRVKRDDGVVVYLNGTEVARDNMPSGVISFSTLALTNAPDDGSTWQQFTINPGLLQAGNNTIAVEIHQVNATSSDISFDLELILSVSNATPITLNGPTTISSRSRSSSGVWSALNRVSYYTQAATQAQIRISEIKYHPYDSTPAEIAAGYNDPEQFEFLELYNTSPNGTVSLNGMQFTAGITLTLSNVNLSPGERAVVVKNTNAFRARYGNVIRVLGQYSGSLNNAGERLTLVDSGLNQVFSVEYNDTNPWPVSADGPGATLVLNTPASTSLNLVGKYYSWRPSVEKGGSPGTVELASWHGD